MANPLRQRIRKRLLDADLDLNLDLLAELVQEEMSRVARLGGRARAAALTKAERCAIAKRAAKARWAKR